MSSHNWYWRFQVPNEITGWSQWPRGLRRRSTAARLLRSWVRIPLGAWMFIYCECCVLSGRGLCDGLITRSGESYRLWRIVVCDQETSHAMRLYSARGLQNTSPQWVVASVEKKLWMNIEYVYYNYMYNFIYVYITSNKNIQFTRRFLISNVILRSELRPRAMGWAGLL